MTQKSESEDYYDLYFTDEKGSEIQRLADQVQNECYFGFVLGNM